MSQESQGPGAGALVEARGNRWRVVEVLDHGECRSCRLVGAAASNLGVHRTLLAPFDRLVPTERAVRFRAVGRRRWMAGLRALLSDDGGPDHLRDVAPARIDLLDYQLEPALACARGATRLLLADEVGLGKTIQAGAILANLHARAELGHALVLCPAGLCVQWRRELRERFRLPASLVDLASLRREARSSLTGAGPWDLFPVAVASVDFVKQPEVLAGMGRIRWDVLVVDEAHLCAVAPERAAAVGTIARRARRVVLLTATPHSGEVDAFEALCGIGRLAAEGPIVMFRRTRSGLGRATARRGRVLRVSLSAPELRMHALLERYTSRVWSAASDAPSSNDARLAMIVLRKRAASGPWPLLVSLSRRLQWLGRPEAAEAAQLSLPLGDVAEPECADDQSWHVLAAPGLSDAGAERRLLERLVEAARAATAHDSKCRALLRLIRRAGEPVIVFTEYRDTLEHLTGILGRLSRIAVVHGGMDLAARSHSIDAFTSGGVDVLLATDAAAHGLNLQARCRLVVDLELPWNPVRLEQRVGRVDRIGQRRIVHAVHLVARDTGEEQVLARLALRVRRAREALNGHEASTSCLSEKELAERVFGGTGAGSVPEAFSETTPGSARSLSDGDIAEPCLVRMDLSAAAREEAAHLEFIRQLTRGRGDAVASASAALEREAPWCCRLRVRAPLPFRRALVAVFRADLVDGRGALVEQHLVTVRCPWPDSLPAALRTARPDRLPDTLTTALGAEAARAAACRLDELMVLLPPRLAGLAARESALAPMTNRPIGAFQPGLFDRREARRVAGERRLEALLADEARAQIEALSSRSRLSLAGPPRAMLVALVECRNWIGTNFTFCHHVFAESEIRPDPHRSRHQE
jgi:superfamily II DNA or RNA helicase